MKTEPILFLGLIFLFSIVGNSEAFPPKCPPEVEEGNSFKPEGKCMSCKCDADGSIGCKGCSQQQYMFRPGFDLRDIPEDTSKPYPQCCATKEYVKLPDQVQCEEGVYVGQMYQPKGTCRQCFCQGDGTPACLGCMADFNKIPDGYAATYIDEDPTKSFPLCCGRDLIYKKSVFNGKCPESLKAGEEFDPEHQCLTCKCKEDGGAACLGCSSFHTRLVLGYGSERFEKDPYKPYGQCCPRVETFKYPDCPSHLKPGDKFYPKGKCQECTCYEGFTDCKQCKMPTDIERPYSRMILHNDARYPKCCPAYFSNTHMPMF